MKNTFKYVALFFAIAAFTACSDEDETTPGGSAPGSGGSTTTGLVGLWKAFEFKGDDGAIYALNQFVPYYDSFTIPGCNIFDYREKYLELTYNFKSDSTVTIIYRSVDEDRTYTVNNAATCDFSYGLWSTFNYSDTSTFQYSIVSNTQF